MRRPALRISSPCRRRACRCRLRRSACRCHRSRTARHCRHRRRWSDQSWHGRKKPREFGMEEVVEWCQLNFSIVKRVAKHIIFAAGVRAVMPNGPCEGACRYVTVSNPKPRRVYRVPCPHRATLEHIVPGVPIQCRLRRPLAAHRRRHPLTVSRCRLRRSGSSPSKPKIFVAAVSGQPVGRVVAKDHVVTAAADGVLDDNAERDGNVVDEGQGPALGLSRSL